MHGWSQFLRNAGRWIRSLRAVVRPLATPESRSVRRRLHRFESIEQRVVLSAAAVAWIPRDLESVPGLLIDVDADGDLDRLDAVVVGDRPYLAWQENLGQERFAAAERVSNDLELPGFDRWGAEQFVADLDQDGDQDAVVVSIGPFSANFLEFYLNEDGFFRRTSRAYVSENGLSDVRFGDVDQDGDLDLLANIWDDSGDFVVHAYLNAPGEFLSRKLLVYSLFARLDTPASEWTDVNADGNLDAVVSLAIDPAEGASLLLFESEVAADGMTVFHRREIGVQPDPAADPWHLLSGDFRSTGSNDLLTFADEVRLLPNQDGSFGEPIVVGEEVTCLESIKQSDERLKVADVDRDGDLDVLAVSCWLENVGEPTAMKLVPHAITERRGGRVVDFDLDGDLDLYFGDAWLEQRVMGDANDDGVFDSADWVVVAAGGRYETDEAARFDEGDWNLDGKFDSRDIVAALQAGTYRGG